MILAEISWQSTVVAVAFLAVVASLMLVVLRKSTVDQALKLWAGLGTLVGVLAGSIPTYFFTDRIAQEQVQRQQADTRTQQAEVQRVQAEKDTITLQLRNLESQMQALRTSMQQQPRGTSVGGLVGSAGPGSRIENSSFTGTVQATDGNNNSQTNAPDKPQLPPSPQKP